MKRKLWTLLLALGAALALCVGAGAGAAETAVGQANQLVGDDVELNGEYKLTADIIIDRSIVIKKDKSVTLDLNGYVLQYKNADKGSVIKVEGGGHLTIQDSRKDDTTAVHKFDMTNDLWVLNDNPPEGKTETISGGVITGGTGYQISSYDGEGNVILNTYYGGGVYVAPGGALTMNGGSIVGCSANGSHLSLGGGVYLGSSANSNAGTFTMDGGSIIGCTADGGGGVLLALGCNFTMNANAVIQSCTALVGGGVYYLGMSGSPGTFTLNGGTIQFCKALGLGGGGVYSSGEFIMRSGTIEGCTSEKDSNESSELLLLGGGGVYNIGKFLMQNGSIKDCTSAKDSNESGGVLNSGQLTISDGTVESNVTNSGTINADGGEITGGVTNSGTITGSAGFIDGTTFSGSVTNNAEGTIQMGTFTGSVTNKGGKVNGFCDFDKATIHGELTVTFDPDNGEQAFMQSVAWNKGGAALTEPSPAPTKAGYTFDGWYRGYQGKWNFVTDKVYFTMTLTAKWTPNTYRVFYYADSYTNEKTHQYDTKIHGQPLTLKGAIFTRSGYTQTGWTTGRVDYALGGTYETNAHVVLLPVWTAIPSTPSYDDSDPTYAVSAPTAENGRIAVSPRYAERGERVTVTLTPDEGYELESLTVTDSRGDALTLTNKGNGRYTFTMPARRVEVKASFVKTVEVSPFADVAIDAYCYEAVKWAQEKGITGGIGNDLFGANQPCTRAQIVTFLWRAAGSPVVNYAMELSDVAEDVYYAEAVRWALSEGVTTGTGEGSFSPDAACTRAQAVTFLARALNAKESGKAEFGDVPTDSYFAEAVAWAAANGVTEGVGGGLFGSDNDCTRAQIVTFLWRAYSR